MTTRSRARRHRGSRAHPYTYALDVPRADDEVLEVWNYWQQKRHGGSYVYVIQEEGGGPVKIGYAHNPFTRCRGLQCGNPRTLRVEALMSGWQYEEALLHHMFQVSGAGLWGEWFAAAEAGRVIELVRRVGRLQIDLDQGNPDPTFDRRDWFHRFIIKEQFPPPSEKPVAA